MFIGYSRTSTTDRELKAAGWHWPSNNWNRARRSHPSQIQGRGRVPGYRKATRFITITGAQFDVEFDKLINIDDALN